MTTFDLNAVISAALTAAVEQATQPLIERIAALEARPTVAPDAAFLAQINDVVRPGIGKIYPSDVFIGNAFHFILL